MEFDDNLYEDYSDNESVTEDALYSSLPHTNWYNESGDEKYFPALLSQRLTQAIHCGDVAFLCSTILSITNDINDIVERTGLDTLPIGRKQLSNGNTLLMEACEHFQEEIVHCLVEEYDVDINYGCCCKREHSLSPSPPTALQLICSSVHSNRFKYSLFADSGSADLRCVSLSRYLLQRGACLCTASALHKMPSGNTVLHCAVLGQCLPLVRLLLHSGCHLNVKNAMGNTALMLAAELGNEAMCRILVKAGADKEVENALGHRVIELAIMNGHFHLRSLLMPRSAPQETHLNLYYAWAVVNGSVSSEKVNQQDNKNTKHLQAYPPIDLSMFCCGLGLSHLIPVLSEAGLNLPQLASMSETELAECGVNRFIDRRRILELFQRLHKSSWGTKKWPSISRNSPVSLIQMLNLVVNVQRQLSLVAASLVYVRENLLRNESVYLSQPDAVMKPVMNTLLQFCEDSLHNCQSTKKNVTEGESLVMKMMAETQEDKYPDLIVPTPDNGRDPSIFRRLSFSLSSAAAIVTVSAGCVMMATIWRYGYMER